VYLAQGLSQRALFAGVQAIVASTQSIVWLIVFALWASLGLFEGSAGRTSPSPSWSASTV